MNLGVLALQGDFAEHCHVLRSLGAAVSEVRLPAHLDGLDGLIIPGGESTALSRLMSRYALREPIAALAARGKAVWGTCAGMIMLASELTESDPVPLALMDVGVQRNAFGRQIDSFEQEIAVKGLGADPYHAIFIRAPVITRVGPAVSVLAALPDGRPVAVQQGPLLATSFHPELTADARIHRYFIALAGGPPYAAAAPRIDAPRVR